MVRIIRGKDIREFLTRDSNQSMLRKKLANVLGRSASTPSASPQLGASVPVVTEANIATFGQKLIDLGFVVRVVDQAFKTKTDEAAAPDATAKKTRPAWPSRVAVAAEQVYDQKGYYMVVYEDSDPTMRRVLLGIIVTVTLFLCMFPAWPMYLKIGAWHVLVAFSTSLLALTVVRMIAFVLVWCVGADFWIFPNMNDEYLGLVDSFKPLYSFEWRKDEKLMLICRFASILMLAGTSYQLAQTHELKDVTDFVQTAYLDVVEWGVDKLTKTPDVKMLPSWEQIEKETRGVDTGKSAAHGDYLEEQEDL
jgi:translocation protein SEC62